MVGVSSVRAENPGVSIAEIVRTAYRAGVPYDDVSVYRGKPDAATTLAEELALPVNRYRRNVVLTIGMIGGPDAVELLSHYLRAGGHDVSSLDAQAKGDALWALGYLANFLSNPELPHGVEPKQSSAAANRCIEVLSKFTLMATPVQWRSGYFRSEGHQRLYLAERAVEAIGFSGHSRAGELFESIDEDLKQIRSQWKSISGRERDKVLKRDLSVGDIEHLQEIVRESRDVHAYVVEKGLASYLRRVQNPDPQARRSPASVRPRQ
jgi:hypothetical protein